MAESSPDQRRDFRYVATGAAGAVTTGAAVWPLIDSLNPSRDVTALASIEISLDGVAPGSRITVKWRGKPVFIDHRVAGRIRQGPVPRNLDGPPYQFCPTRSSGSGEQSRNMQSFERSSWQILVS